MKPIPVNSKAVKCNIDKSPRQISCVFCYLDQIYNENHFFYKVNYILISNINF